MNSPSEDSDAPSPVRGSQTSASTRQQSRMRQDGSRSTAVTPFVTQRTGTLGSHSNNATISETDNIKVAVRVRPLFSDKERDAIPVLQVTEDHSTVQVVVPGPAGNRMQREFQFHACLGPDVSQSDVMSLCGIPQLLDAALSGYNVTIFAYGQTGSGKTYTMSGREEVISLDDYQGDTADGIITRSVHYLYQQLRDRKDCKVSLSASYLEIYNEAVFDLLTARMTGGTVTGGLVGGRPVLASKDLGIKWDPAHGFFVPGLKVVPCKTVEAMMEVIRLGMKHRHVGSHQLNMESSRSHALMTIHTSVVGTDPAAWDYGTPRYGKICFVDLAGSERLKDSKSEGTMLKETTNINKSLFVLGKVISALAERDTLGVSNSHIPYRDSKLTKLLMDSLGGSALALMIACCSPNLSHVEETLSTLSYATRAKNIQNRPTVQYDPKEAQITALRREIELLRQENQYLREQIRLGGGTVSIPSTPSHTLTGPTHSMDPTHPNHPHHTHNNSLPTDPTSSTYSPRLGSGRPDWPALRRRDSASSPLPPVSYSALSNRGSQDLHSQPSYANASGWGSPRDSQDLGNGAQREQQGGHSGRGLPVRMSLHPPATARTRLASQSTQSLSNQQDWQGNGNDAGGGEEDGGYDSGEGGEGGAVYSPVRAGRGGMGGGVGASGVWRGGGQRMGTPEPGDLSRRLQDTQDLLAKFSAENERLARENDRLRMNRALLGSEHANVLDEIESLRSQLSGLESALLTGNASPSAAKALLTTLRQNVSTAAPPSGASQPPSRDVSRHAAHGSSLNSSVSRPQSNLGSPAHAAVQPSPWANNTQGASQETTILPAPSQPAPLATVFQQPEAAALGTQPSTQPSTQPPTHMQPRPPHSTPPTPPIPSAPSPMPQQVGDKASRAAGGNTAPQTPLRSQAATPVGSAVAASRSAKSVIAGGGADGGAGGKNGGGGGNVIVANQAALAMLLGDGPQPGSQQQAGPMQQPQQASMQLQQGFQGQPSYQPMPPSPMQPPMQPPTGYPDNQHGYSVQGPDIPAGHLLGTMQGPGGMPYQQYQQYKQAPPGMYAAAGQVPGMKPQGVMQGVPMQPGGMMQPGYGPGPGQGQQIGYWAPPGPGT